MRTFEFTDAKSRKFWNIEATGTYYQVQFGKIGSTGQTQRKTFATAAEAQAAMDKLIKEKLKKGYVETTAGTAAPAPTSVPGAAEDAAFHKALTDNPNDLAGWCAYADWLVEHGDPRGEFMQTQLALEDEARPKKERDALKKKESALLKKHEKEWLGGLAPFVFEDEEAEDYDADYPIGARAIWERGVLSGVVVERLSTAMAQTLVTDPAARFVRELRVHDTMSHHTGGFAGDPPLRVKTPAGVQRHSELYELIGSPFLANLRAFQLGSEIPPEDGWCDCHMYLQGLEHVVAGMARVEVLDLYCKGYDTRALFGLPNLTHLRELRAYHQFGSGGVRRGEGYVYPLDVLANNPALADLTHLQFHPHQSEDGFDGTEVSYIPLEQVRALVHSKYLKKRTHLQLRLSDMGDDGVREIVASGILKQLRWLDLRHGCVTDEGADLFVACPDAKNLERLDLSRNAVSAKGLAALRKAGVNAVANDPLTQSELDSRQYLREGDFE
ncbi:MAG: WGR domain-containing protein [Planctomycetes bacterium]|nr:WGR domain-containing protein [Planctomycetota bacterium]